MLTVPLLAAAIDSWPLPFYRFCPPIILFHPLPSSSMQEVRLPIRLQDKKTFFFLDISFPIVILFMCFCPSSFLYLCMCIFLLICLLHQSLLPSNIYLHRSVCQHCLFVFISIVLYVFICFCKFASMYYSYLYSPDTSFVLVSSCLHIFKAELPDSAHPQMSLIKVNIMLTHNRQ